MADKFTERVASRQCAWCGDDFEPGRRGRRPTYCTDRCRRRAWEVRTAVERLGGERAAAPKVVREVVERVIETTGPEPAARADEPTAPTPADARAWAAELGELARQLRDERHQTHRQHYHHRRLYDALVLATRALGDAHPGGLDRLN